MKIRHISAAFALAGVLLATPGCKDFFDVNVDPINPTSARLSDLLPVTQVAMATHLGMGTNGLGPATSTLVSQYASGRDVGSYSVEGSSFSNQWVGLYTSMLSNNEQIIKQGTTSADWTYVGIAQLQKAYVFSIMVDMWGGIPYSQALQGAALQAPRFDADADIYLGTNDVQSLFSLIDEGLANLAKTGPDVGGPDLIYGGNRAAWGKFGRSLKLKLYNQIRKVNGEPRIGDLAAKVRTLLNEAAMPDKELISSNAEDFEFKYNASSNPDNRNLGYTADYTAPSRENFISPYFYRLMRGPNIPAGAPAEPDANYIDPRLPYYFFNQKGNTAAVAVPVQYGRFVTVPLGSNNTAANAANSNVRTLPGLYPVGGRYDNGVGVVATDTSGKGAVAQRFLTYASRMFTEAEARLMILNDVAGAEAAYRAGVEAAYAKVNQIATANRSPVIPAATVMARVADAMTAFANGAGNEGKLRAIMKEKYVAGFGFGPDVYTDYRRTGYPAIRIPGSEPNTQLNGAYPRRLAYNQDDLTTNPKAPAQPNLATDRIFWDR